MRAHPKFVVCGWHVMASLLAFFGLVIAVNAAFIATAIKTFPGEDVQRSYLQGLNYNATLRERAAQARLGWMASAALIHVQGGAALDVELKDRFGAPIDGLNLNGVLRWPTDSRKDRALKFEALRNGLYRAMLPDLAEGGWRLRARADDAAGGALDFEANLLWPVSH